MFKIITIIFLSLSFSLLANTSDISKNLKEEIIKNNKQDKTSFVVFNLDNTLINITPRYKLIFNNYLKKHPLRVVKKYIKEKSFSDLSLNDVLFDINNLKLNDIQKDKLKDYLKKEFNSIEIQEADTAIENTVKFIKDLHKNGAFIIYLTKRSHNQLVATINTLNKLEFPIGINKTSLIMNENTNKNYERLTLSTWIHMGEIIGVFHSNIDTLTSLKPYFKTNKLFYISSKKIIDNKITTIKGF